MLDAAVVDEQRLEFVFALHVLDEAEGCAVADYDVLEVVAHQTFLELLLVEIRERVGNLSQMPIPLLPVLSAHLFFSLSIQYLDNSSAVQVLYESPKFEIKRVGSFRLLL